MALYHMWWCLPSFKQSPACRDLPPPRPQIPSSHQMLLLNCANMPIHMHTQALASCVGTCSEPQCLCLLVACLARGDTFPGFSQGCCMGHSNWCQLWRQIHRGTELAPPEAGAVSPSLWRNSSFPGEQELFCLSCFCLNGTWFTLASGTLTLLCRTRPPHPLLIYVAHASHLQSSCSVWGSSTSWLNVVLQRTSLLCCFWVTGESEGGDIVCKALGNFPRAMREVYEKLSRLSSYISDFQTFRF